MMYHQPSCMRPAKIMIIISSPTHARYTDLPMISDHALQGPATRAYNAFMLRATHTECRETMVCKSNIETFWRYWKQVAAVHEYIGSGAEKDGQVADGEVQHTHTHISQSAPTCNAFMLRRHWSEWFDFACCQICQNSLWWTNLVTL